MQTTATNCAHAANCANGFGDRSTSASNQTIRQAMRMISNTLLVISRSFRDTTAFKLEVVDAFLLLVIRNGNAVRFEMREQEVFRNAQRGTLVLEPVRC